MPRFNNKKIQEAFEDAQYAGRLLANAQKEFDQASLKLRILLAEETAAVARMEYLLKGKMDLAKGQIRLKAAKELIRSFGGRFYCDKRTKGWSLKPWWSMKLPHKVYEALDRLADRVDGTTGNPHRHIPPTVRFYFRKES